MDAHEALDRLTLLTLRVGDDLRPELEQIVAVLAPSSTTGRLDRFEDLGLLGAGAMGEVRRVNDPVLGRTVAMKLLASSGSDDVALRARFVEEARVSGQLQHPAIVPVHELGSLPDGRPWFTMREVKGRTLAEIVSSGDWSQRRLLDVLLRVAEAVAYAHSRGVVHRDLKPSNVMVGDYGEVFVVDWGVAKVLGAPEGPRSLREEAGAVAWTRYGTVLGSPVSMSPEQAAGDPEAIGPGTDVWGLGVLLYEILVGRPPLVGDAFTLLARLLDPALDIRRVPTTTPVAPAVWDLCERCLRTDPASRPRDGGEVAAALRDILEGVRQREVALTRVTEAIAVWREAEELTSRADALDEEARALLLAVPQWAPEDARHTAWGLQDEAGALRVRAELAALSGEQRAGSALAEIPGLPEAHAALAAHYRTRSGPRAEALLRQHAEALPTDHPDRAQHLVRLMGGATLSLRTSPPAEVVLEVHAVRHRRWVVAEERSLGVTPLVCMPLAAGSSRLRLSAPGRIEVLLPISPDRGDDLVLDDQVLPEWIPEGTIYVAPGAFLAGGDPRRVRRRLWCDGFVIGRHPVTVAEYCLFLADLMDRGRQEEALLRASQVPAGRHGPGAYLLSRDDAGRFVPGVDLDGDVVEADWPMTCVGWADAVAYAAWMRERTGLPWRLPGDLEWEKAARGVDGRTFPWGEQPDASRCNSRDSHEATSGLTSVHAFPADEGPFGLRGAAGNVRDWTGDAWTDEWSPLDGDRVVPPPLEPRAPARVVGRGGAWPLWSGGCNVTMRVEDRPDYRHPGVGFRIACSWPPPTDRSSEVP